MRAVKILEKLGSNFDTTGPSSRIVGNKHIAPRDAVSSYANSTPSFSSTTASSNITAPMAYGAPDVKLAVQNASFQLQRAGAASSKASVEENFGLALRALTGFVASEPNCISRFFLSMSGAVIL